VAEINARKSPRTLDGSRSAPLILPHGDAVRFGRYVGIARRDVLQAGHAADLEVAGYRHYAGDGEPSVLVCALSRCLRQEHAAVAHRPLEAILESRALRDVEFELPVHYARDVADERDMA
jgi:hypothetical protein